MIIPSKFSNLDLSDPIYSYALDQLVNTNNNLNIIGSAGTGKSILLSLAYDMLKNQGKNVVVVCPTGIASFNLQKKGIPAVTIHSFFKLPPASVYSSGMIHINNNLYELMNNIDVLIIDEVSFMNCSLLDFIHELLLNYRSKQEQNIPRMILFGDPLQLESPMDKKDKAVMKYFDELYEGKINYFNANSFRDYGYKVIQLTKIFRQSNEVYQSIFNRVRQGTQTNEDLIILNEQVISEEEYFKRNEMYLYLSPTNAGADLVNKSYYDILEGRPRMYETYIHGDVDLSKKKNIHERIYLKKDCQVMCLFNAPDGSYVNGTLAKVTKLNDDDVEAIKENGEIITIGRHQLQDYKYDYNEITKQITLNKCGDIDTLGCTLGFSLTYHKTQSMSLDTYYIDLAKGMFANGMLYVAISRAVDFTKVGLSRPLAHQDVIVSNEALEFLGTI